MIKKDGRFMLLCLIVCSLALLALSSCRRQTAQGPGASPSPARGANTAAPSSVASPAATGAARAVAAGGRKIIINGLASVLIDYAVDTGASPAPDAFTPGVDYSGEYEDFDFSRGSTIKEIKVCNSDADCSAGTYAATLTCRRRPCSIEIETNAGGDIEIEERDGGLRVEFSRNKFRSYLNADGKLVHYSRNASFRPGEVKLKYGNSCGPTGANCEPIPCPSNKCQIEVYY